MANYLYVPFPRSIQEGIRRREEDMASLQKPRSTWMRLTSGFMTDGQEHLRVLMGGDINTGEGLRFGFENMYEEGGTPPLRPIPGINNVSVNDTGAITTIDVQWSCWTHEQLNDLLPYFMNPGVSMVLDFGWSDVDPDVILDVSDLNQVRSMFQKIDGTTATTDADYMDAQPRLRKIKEGKGSYYVISGSLSDASVSVNEQGGFDCTCQITGSSETHMTMAIRSQKVRRFPTNEKGVPSVYEYIKNRLSDDIRSERRFPVSETHLYTGNALDSGLEGQTGRFYMSWRAFEQEVLNKHSTYKNAFNRNLFEFDSSNTLISSVDNLFSSDLDTCIVIPPDVSARGTNLRALNQKPPDTTAEIDPSKQEGYLYNLYISSNVIYEAIEANDRVVDAVRYILDKCSAACYDIWDFDIAYVEDTAMVVDKNNAFGRNISDYLDSHSEELFTFKPNSKSSIVRNFGFETSMNEHLINQLKMGHVTKRRDSDVLDGTAPEDLDQETAVIYNDTQDSNNKLFQLIPGFDVLAGEMTPAATLVEMTGFNLDTVRSAVNEGRFATVLQSVNSASAEANPPSEVLEELEEELEEANATATELGLNSFNPLKDPLALYNFKKELRTDRRESSPINSNQVVELQCSLEIDGTAGIMLRHLFDVSYIPDHFRNNGIFVATDVTHSVSASDWSTSITGNLAVRNLFAAYMDSLNASPTIASGERDRYLDEGVVTPIDRPHVATFDLAGPIRTSQAGIDMIKQFEGFSEKKYRDADGYSIGYGHFIKKGESFREPMSRENAEILLRRDIQAFETCVANSVRVDVTQNQFDAMVSLAYNIGCGAFSNSTLVRKLNSGDYRGAADQFDVWIHSQGQVLQTLVRRRQTEKNLFNLA